MAAETVPIASIVQVGADAPVGDIVVAAAVLTERIDRRINVESTRDGNSINLQMSMNVSSRDSGKTLAVIKLTPESDGKFVFDTSGSRRPQEQLIGELFKTYSEIAEFSVAVGFCPRSEVDLFRRLESAAHNLSKLVKMKYPNAFMCNFSIPQLVEKKSITWADGAPMFPKGTLTVTDEAVRSMSDMAMIQSLLSVIVAEAVASAVRTARTYDLSDIYPALKLDSNLGYGCQDLYHGLRKFPSLESRGFRGDLTEAWIQEAEKTFAPAQARNRVRGASGPKLAPKQISRDGTGREVMGFDKTEATRMCDELNTELTNDTPIARRWSQWTKDFVSSIHSQLQSGRRLTGRQMYVLNEVYAKKGW